MSVRPVRSEYSTLTDKRERLSGFNRAHVSCKQVVDFADQVAVPRGRGFFLLARGVFPRAGLRCRRCGLLQGWRASSCRRRCRVVCYRSFTCVIFEDRSMVGRSRHTGGGGRRARVNVSFDSDPEGVIEDDLCQQSLPLSADF